MQFGVLGLGCGVAAQRCLAADPTPMVNGWPLGWVLADVGFLFLLIAMILRLGPRCLRWCRSLWELMT